MSPELLEMRGYEEACKSVGLYAGGDSSKSITALIAATEASYKDELVDASPARVLELQHYLRQLRALRDVIQGNGGTPKI